MKKPTLELVEGRPFGEIFEAYKDQKRISRVESFDSLSSERFHREIVPAHYPVVFKWPLELPSSSTLLRKISDSSREILVRTGDYAKAGVTIAKREHVKMTVEQYVNHHLYSETKTDDAPPYAGRVDFSKGFLSPHLSPPDFYPAHEYEDPFVWLGATGCITQLHKDGSANFASHLFGQKQWTLFPPRDAPNLYLTRVIEESDFATSEVDLNNPDFEKSPLFADAVPITVNVSAREVLYLPEGWGHHVKNIEPTLMVNYWRKRK